MPQAFDFQTTVNAMITAVRTEVQQDWIKVSSFVATQAKLLTHLGASIAESSISGDLRNDPVLQHDCADLLAQQVRNFAYDLAARTILTAEKAWNAASGVLWGAINVALQAAGLGFLVPPTL